MADDRGAQQLVVAGVGNDLDESRSVPHSPGLAVGGERELVDLDVVALVPGLLLGVSERRDLWLAVGDARDHVVVDRHGLGTRDGLGGDDALGLGSVGQHELGRAVPDGVDARHIGAHEVVHGDGAAFGELHAGGLQPEPLGARGESDGLQHPVGLQHPCIAALGRGDGDLDLVTGVVDGVHLGGRHDLHTHLLVGAGELLGDLGVLVGNHAVQELHDRHLGTVVGQYVGELRADGAGAGNDDRLGNLVGEDLLAIGDDPFGQLGARQRLHRRAGGDDAAVEGEFLTHRSPVVLDDDPPGPGELAPAVVLGDLVLLHEVVDAIHHAAGHVTGAGVGLAEVNGDIT